MDDIIEQLATRLSGGEERKECLLQGTLLGVPVCITEARINRDELFLRGAGPVPGDDAVLQLTVFGGSFARKTDLTGDSGLRVSGGITGRQGETRAAEDGSLGCVVRIGSCSGGAVPVDLQITGEDDGGTNITGALTVPVKTGSGSLLEEAPRASEDSPVYPEDMADPERLAIACRLMDWRIIREILDGGFSPDHPVEDGLFPLEIVADAWPELGEERTLYLTAMREGIEYSRQVTDDDAPRTLTILLEAGAPVTKRCVKLAKEPTIDGGRVKLSLKLMLRDHLRRRQS